MKNRSPSRRRSVPVLLALALASPSCAARQTATVYPPFDTELTRFFDDAVDYVAGGTGFSHLTEEFTAQFQGSWNNADLIAKVRVETVVQGVDLDGHRNLTISAAVVRPIRGSAERLSLRATEGQPGFSSVVGREGRLQSGTWYLFVKYYADAERHTLSHWHLIPATESVNNRVEDAINAATRPVERVVRREGNPVFNTP